MARTRQDVGLIMLERKDTLNGGKAAIPVHRHSPDFPAPELLR